jgi:hypothetical protein
MFKYFLILQNCPKLCLGLEVNNFCKKLFDSVKTSQSQKGVRNMGTLRLPPWNMIGDLQLLGWMGDAEESRRGMVSLSNGIFFALVAALADLKLTEFIVGPGRLVVTVPHLLALDRAKLKSAVQLVAQLVKEILLLDPPVDTPDY